MHSRPRLCATDLELLDGCGTGPAAAGRLNELLVDLKGGVDELRLPAASAASLLRNLPRKTLAASGVQFVVKVPHVDDGNCQAFLDTLRPDVPWILDCSADQTALLSPPPEHCRRLLLTLPPFPFERAAKEQARCAAAIRALTEAGYTVGGLIFESGSCDRPPAFYSDRIKYFFLHPPADGLTLSLRPSDARHTAVACAEMALLNGVTRIEGTKLQPHIGYLYLPNLMHNLGERFHNVVKSGVVHRPVRLLWPPLPPSYESELGLVLPRDIQQELAEMICRLSGLLGGDLPVGGASIRKLFESAFVEVPGPARLLSYRVTQSQLHAASSGCLLTADDSAEEWVLLERPVIDPLEMKSFGTDLVTLEARLEVDGWDTPPIQTEEEASSDEAVAENAAAPASGGGSSSCSPRGLRSNDSTKSVCVWNLKARGNGPVDAFLRALNARKASAAAADEEDPFRRWEIEDLRENALGSGSSAQALCFVKLCSSDTSVWGVARHTNSTTASLRAICCGLNRASAKQREGGLLHFALARSDMRLQ